MKKNTRSVIRTAYLRFLALFMSMILGVSSITPVVRAEQVQRPYEYWYFAIHGDQEALEIIKKVFEPGMCRTCLINVDIECNSIDEITPPFEAEILVPVLRQIAYHYPEAAPRDMLVCAAASMYPGDPLVLNDVADRLIEKRVSWRVRHWDVGDRIVIADATLRPRPGRAERTLQVIVVIALGLAAIALAVAVEKAKWERAWGD